MSRASTGRSSAGSSRRGGSRAGVRYGDGQVVELVGKGLFYKERKRIPFWAVLLWQALCGLLMGTVWAVRLACRYPLPTAALTVAALVSGRWGRTGLVVALVAGLTVTAAGLGLWWWQARPSCRRWVVEPARGLWHWHTGYRWRWREAMRGVGLLRVWDDVERVPQVARVRSTPTRDVLTVQLLAGQTPDSFAGTGEALGHVYGAFRADVTPAGPGWVTLTFWRRDPLADPIAVTHPVYAAAITDAHHLGPTTGNPDTDAATRAARVTRLLDGVPVGLAEDATVCRVTVRGGHLLVAGTTGSGKSGLLWAILWALAPAIRAGLVEVAALDPKRMELAALAGPLGHVSEGIAGATDPAGRPLGVVVKDADVMPAYLDGLVRDLDARCEALEGRTRVHVPSVGMPHRLVIVDELATLTALADRKDRERVEAALGALESRGRAAGYSVIVTTVEPTKEVVRWRALHHVRVGFRMEEPSHTDMVLGDGVADRGARCDHINPHTPGVAFVKVDGIADPVRARIVAITDDDITTLTTPPPAPSSPVRGGSPVGWDVAEVADLDPADVVAVELPVPTPRSHP